MIEKRRETNLETHVAFLDYQKAFDRVKHSFLWRVMERRGFLRHLIRAVRSLYRDTRIVISLGQQFTQEIKTTQGVRQGCGLSPTLFNIYINEGVQLVRVWKQKSKQESPLTQALL